jgi:putative ABC transport system substrate-binding protein
VYGGGGIWGKLFQLLMETRPGARRIALLWSYLPPHFPAEEMKPGLEELRADARALGVELLFGEMRRPEDAGRALADVAKWRPDGVVLTSGPGIWQEVPRILQRFAEQRWLSITDSSGTITELDPGPLLAYAPGPADLRRQTVGYIDRIMRGAQPAELPIEAPSRYELVVNLKTARAIGIVVPQAVRLRADRVIE